MSKQWEYVNFYDWEQWLKTLSKEVSDKFKAENKQANGDLDLEKIKEVPEFKTWYMTEVNDHYFYDSLITYSIIENKISKDEINTLCEVVKASMEDGLYWEEEEIESHTEFIERVVSDMIVYKYGN